MDLSRFRNELFRSVPNLTCISIKGKSALIGRDKLPLVGEIQERWLFEVVGMLTIWGFRKKIIVIDGNDLVGDRRFEITYLMSCAACSGEIDCPTGHRAVEL